MGKSHLVIAILVPSLFRYTNIRIFVLGAVFVEIERRRVGSGRQHPVRGHG